MKVLIIGSGGREHSLAWKLKQSPLLTHLFAAPGNPGIAELADLLPVDPGEAHRVIAACKEHDVGLVVIGPEAPLVAGLADELRAAGVPVFGPGRGAAQLEGSKAFTKALCSRAGIPTAAYEIFTDANQALGYLRRQSAPVVVKADGLAAGKGVRLCASIAAAEEAVSDCFAGVFGDAGRSVIIEEMLVGEEASFFAICDGTAAIPLAAAQDHKRAFDGDEGPNTGGMGAYSPAPVMTPALIERVMAEIIHPTLAEMRDMGAPFRGVLYAGLMITADGPKLIEYNVRFGDPECQALMLRLESDLLPVLSSAATGAIETAPLRWRDEVAVTVVMAARGYPGTYAKGTVIRGLEQASAIPGVTIFHAGTARAGDGALVANGGRVLNVSARGATVAAARERAYSAVALIDWPEGFYRTDIGARAMEREIAA